MKVNPILSIKKYGKERLKTKVILVEKGKVDAKSGLLPWQVREIKSHGEDFQQIYTSQNDKQTLFVIQVDLNKSSEGYKIREQIRRAGSNLLTELKKHKTSQLIISSLLSEDQYLMDLAEGIALANYQYLNYKTTKKENPLKEVYVDAASIDAAQLEELQIVIESTCIARDLVNTPVMDLNAEDLSKQFKKMGKEAQFKVEVLDKKEIKKLEMGGLLAVNMGSIDPPTFTIMEYKPAKAVNKKPYVLVGKGVVYDTGGLSLKPTPNSMDHMKSDMAGAAAVGGTLYCIAKNNLPIHVIGLVPATDNRPGEHAYTPGDVLTMYNKKTVEVLNTDAEGRLILGDALTYADQYKPELVIDLATLTGAQLVAVGSLGSAFMGTASEEVKNELKRSGLSVYERIAELPFWDEYGDLIKSDIADLKNIGGPEAGCITAGKFLESFVTSPWLHIDIAGPSFLNAPDGYRPKGGTGVGVRLLYHFFKSKVNQ